MSTVSSSSIEPAITLSEAGIATLSFKQIFDEMSKVILLCASCHSIIDDDRHGKRGNAFGD